LPINRNLPLAHLVEPQQQLDERTFARAGGPHNADGSSSGNVQRQVFEHEMATLIGKGDLVKLHAARDGFKRQGATAGGNGDRRIQQRHHPTHRGHGALVLIHQFAEVGKGPQQPLNDKTKNP
jgi:hypothetical protein